MGQEYPSGYQAWKRVELLRQHHEIITAHWTASKVAGTPDLSLCDTGASLCESIAEAYKDLSGQEHQGAIWHQAAANWRATKKYYLTARPESSKVE